MDDKKTFQSTPSKTVITSITGKTYNVIQYTNTNTNEQTDRKRISDSSQVPQG